MTNLSIKLFDLLAKKERVYGYGSNETIGDLRRNIAQLERYDSPEKVKIILAFLPRYLYGLDFGQGHAQTYFFDFWQWDSMLIPPRGVRSQSRGGKLEVLHF